MRRPALIHALFWIALSLCVSTLQGQDSSLFGDWREPMGSIIRVEHCGAGICLRLVFIRPGAPSTFDIHNPDPALRNRSLCDLQIGEGFHLNDSNHAVGGRLYDPKSGGTYHGTMTLEDSELKLHGYIGYPIFGRTEVWKKATERHPACAADEKR